MVDITNAGLQSVDADARPQGAETGAPPGPKAPSQPPSHMVPTRHIRVRGRDIPVVPPRLRDLRLRLSAVILALQVLGQTVLKFKVSIAQILITMAVCAAIELTVTLWRDQVLAWPASAIQTGASVAFILRASGTRHGDYWSLRGIHLFVIAAVISLASKYLLRRPNGRHVFNPSNAGIVAVLIVVGPRYVFSEHLWWGPLGPGVILTVAVILFGGLWILRTVKMVPMVLSYLCTFGVILAIFALTGRSFYATWSPDAVTGVSYWLNIALSPEVVAYAFFMMSDPQTAPKSPRARIIYGGAGAVVTSALLYFQHTEFGIKVAILASLTVICAIVPFIEAAGRRMEGRRSGATLDDVATNSLPLKKRLVAAACTPAIAAVSIIAVAAAVDTVALVANKEVVGIERNLPAESVAPGATPARQPHRQ